MSVFFLEFLPNDQTCRDPTNQLEEKGGGRHRARTPSEPSFPLSPGGGPECGTGGGWRRPGMRYIVTVMLYKPRQQLSRLHLSSQPLELRWDHLTASQFWRQPCLLSFQFPDSVLCWPGPAPPCPAPNLASQSPGRTPWPGGWMNLGISQSVRPVWLR